MRIVLEATKALAEKARLAVLLRRQHDSVPLRELFRERYGIDVGMQSYGCFDRWRMRGPMRVGRYCSIAKTVRTVLDNHPTDALTTHPALYEAKFGVIETDRQWTGTLEIEDDVWIGHYAVLLPGCRRVGRGAIIGAGAVVTRDVEPYTIVVGNPAKMLRRRFPDELITAIERTRWWELDPPALRALARERPDLLFHPTVAGLDRWSEERGQ